MTPPLSMSAVKYSINFGVYGACKRSLERMGWRSQDAICCTSGCVGGAASAFIVTPIELLRNRLQVQYHKIGAAVAHSGSAPLYSGPVDCFIKVIKNEGVMTLFRGFIPTVLRDGPGNAAWFGAYEFMKRQLVNSSPVFDPSTSHGSVLTPMVAGATAGVSYWIIALPFDAVKSIIQTSQIAGQKPPGVIDTAMKIVSEYGWSRFYRGFSVAALRGMPGAAMSFVSYEFAFKML
eukprot:CAMPEP_0174254196 /NCGR_PEP_ID=MMETSP0439-20130205/3537_1 /TAXON_ID=0 /ORGANISM="Stereomyxa ramosa, Strain Chinc5" /LENGTH=233 /DNA_ID=CAMNT_0015335651 /DNA_START=252 /DNA_END=949 /DNA_ORIENTATION=+